MKETRKPRLSTFEPRFDFERLEVYQLIRRHLMMVVETGDELPKASSKTRDHLDRSTDSIQFNTAEGSGKPRRSKDRRKFLDIALSSAKEAAAAWDNLYLRGYVSLEASDEARSMLVRIVQMLIKLE